MAAIEVTLPVYHSAQAEIAQDGARFKVLMCGRRFGKSTLLWSELCETAIDGYPAGLFAPTYKYALDGWRFIRAALAPITRKANEQEMRIELINDGALDVWTLDKPDPGRGRKYKRAGIDEAGIVRDLATRWNAAIRPTLTDYRGDALIVGTPCGPGDFNDMFERGQKDGQDRWRSWRYKTIDNPHMDDQEVAEAKEEIPEKIFLQEYEGIPDDEGGNPFGLTAIAACVREKPSTSETVAYGGDLAKSEDWTVIIGLDADGNWTEFYRFQGLWNEQFERIKKIVGNTPALFDSTGVGDPIVESLQRDLPNVEGFKFTANSKQQIMEGLRSAVQTGRVTIPAGDCASEMRTFRYEYHKNGVRYEAPPNFHDDCVCSLALAVKAVADMPQCQPSIISLKREPMSLEQRIQDFMLGDDEPSTSIFHR